MKEAVRDLGQTLEEAASETGVVSGLIDSIGKALAEVRCSSVNSLRTCYKCEVIGWVGKKTARIRAENLCSFRADSLGTLHFNCYYI